jgi:hypothetical protein
MSGLGSNCLGEAEYARHVMLVTNFHDSDSPLGGACAPLGLEETFRPFR